MPERNRDLLGRIVYILHKAKAKSVRVLPAALFKVERKTPYRALL
jgi:hypothetical protein